MISLPSTEDTPDQLILNGQRTKNENRDFRFSKNRSASSDGVKLLTLPSRSKPPSKYGASPRSPLPSGRQASSGNGEHITSETLTQIACAHHSVM